MFITNDSIAAQAAVNAGVNRIFVDLELLGKIERQQGRNTVISHHRPQDISLIRDALPETEILVRTNPMHEGLAREVDEVISRGANILMLPMFTHPEEVRQFVGYIEGRARVSLLLETTQAMIRLPLILEMKNDIHEIYIGLNDLHLGLGLDFMFEPVSSGLVEFMANQILASGLSFGFGGIGRVGTGLVPANLVLSEHIRMGSSLVILSRTFHQSFQGSLQIEVEKLRSEERRLSQVPEEVLLLNRDEFNRYVWHAAAVDLK